MKEIRFSVTDKEFQKIEKLAEEEGGRLEDCIKKIIIEAAKDVLIYDSETGYPKQSE
jgi:hypothetical protein